MRIPYVRLGPEGSGDNTEGEVLEKVRHSKAVTYGDPGVGSLDENINLDFLVGTLRADWKRFVRLRFWDDKSCAHIASWEGCSPRTINRGLSAALKQLRCQLDEEKEAV